MTPTDTVLAAAVAGDVTPIHITRTTDFYSVLLPTGREMRTPGQLCLGLEQKNGMAGPTANPVSNVQ